LKLRIYIVAALTALGLCVGTHPRPALADTTNLAIAQPAGAGLSTLLVSSPGAPLRIYVLALAVTLSDTAAEAATLKLVYGTGATCGVGTVNLTGPFANSGAASSDQLINLSAAGQSGYIFVVPAGNNLCSTTTGATLVALNGYMTYQISP